MIGFGAVALAGALFLAIGAPRDRSAPRATPTPEPANVAASGVTLVSVGAELPADDLALPDRPGRDLLEANCTACHSPAMIPSQPPLKPEQWQAEVKKMVEAYHAPVDPAAVPGILAYLNGLSTSGAAPPPRSAPRPTRSPPPTS